MNKDFIPQIIGKIYTTQTKIGAGSFGEIYKGENIKTHDLVAIKFEQKGCPHPQLKNELDIYRALSGCPGIPKIYWHGEEGQYRIIVMELLEKSLGSIMKGLEHPFSVKSVLMIGEQMLSIIQYIHEKNYIHRDIKPDNFLMKANNLYLIDFGLAKKYRDPTSFQHIPYKTDRKITGTVQYVSINTHMGLEQSRRDDLESIGYVLIYLAKGALPWQKHVFQNLKDKSEEIGNRKLETSYSGLCSGLPRGFQKYFEIVRNIEFDGEPPYRELRSLFRNMMLENHIIYDYMYDWKSSEPIKEEQKAKSIKTHEIIVSPNGLPPLPHSSLKARTNLLKSMDVSKNFNFCGKTVSGKNRINNCLYLDGSTKNV